MKLPAFRFDKHNYDLVYISSILDVLCKCSMNVHSISSPQEEREPVAPTMLRLGLVISANLVRFFEGLPICGLKFSSISRVHYPRAVTNCRQATLN